jgi:hypothetical protein
MEAKGGRLFEDGRLRVRVWDKGREIKDER